MFSSTKVFICLMQIYMSSLGCNSLRILMGTLDIFFGVVWVVGFYFSTLKIPWWQSELWVDICLCGERSELVHSTYSCIWICFWLCPYVRKIPSSQEDDSCFIRLMASKSGTSQINRYSQIIQISTCQSGFKGWIMLPTFSGLGNKALSVGYYQYFVELSFQG